MSSAIVPVFTYASPINHSMSHEVADATSGHEWTEAAIGSNSFTADSVVRVHELRADKASSDGSAAGMIKTQQLLVSNAPYNGTTADSWDDTSSTRISTFNRSTNDTPAALVVRNGGARIGGGLRVQSGDLYVQGYVDVLYEISAATMRISQGNMTNMTVQNYLTFAAHPRFCAHLVANQAGTTTFSIIKPWTTTFNALASFSASAGTFTAPVAGFYRFVFSSRSEASTTIGYVQIYKNNVGTTYSSFSNSGTQPYTTLEVILQLAVGDVIDLRLQGSGANVSGGTTSNRYTFFTGELISCS